MNELRGLHLHFEPTAGIAGDMAVAALVDAGVPASVVVDAVGAMGIEGLQVALVERHRGGVKAAGYQVTLRHAHGDVETHDHSDSHSGHHGHPHHHHEHGRGHRHEQGHHEHGRSEAGRGGHEHRDFATISRTLESARISDGTRRIALAILDRLATVEAEVHGVSKDRVAFHEVGAWDSIADVVGVAAAIDWLAPRSISSAPPVVGTGTVRIAHGVVPVPAPATAALLMGREFRCEGQGELTTPTGAAILAALTSEFGPPPPMRLRAMGYGAGNRELQDRPNVVRVLVGEPVGVLASPSATEVLLLEANLDDMSPQLVAPLFAALFDAGALDVWATSILMKKGRPALQISALAPPETRAAIERAFFLNSTTLGVRVSPMSRSVLSRSFAEVSTRFGSVKVKLGSLEGRVIRAQPEFEDCRTLAEKAAVPVADVVAEAAALALALRRDGVGGSASEDGAR